MTDDFFTSSESEEDYIESINDRKKKFKKGQNTQLNLLDAQGKIVTGDALIKRKNALVR